MDLDEHKTLTFSAIMNIVDVAINIDSDTTDITLILVKHTTSDFSEEERVSLVISFAMDTAALSQLFIKDMVVLIVKPFIESRQSWFYDPSHTTISILQTPDNARRIDTETICGRVSEVSCRSDGMIGLRIIPDFSVFEEIHLTLTKDYGVIAKNRYLVVTLVRRVEQQMDNIRVCVMIDTKESKVVMRGGACYLATPQIWADTAYEQCIFGAVVSVTKSPQSQIEHLVVVDTGDELYECKSSVNPNVSFRDIKGVFIVGEEYDFHLLRQSKTSWIILGYTTDVCKALKSRLLIESLDLDSLNLDATVAKDLRPASEDTEHKSEFDLKRDMRVRDATASGAKSTLMKRKVIEPFTPKPSILVLESPPRVKQKMKKLRKT